MKITTTFLASALVGSLSSVGMAQAPAPQAPRPAQAGADTTVQGCLEKNKSGGYWLTRVMMSPSGSSPVGTSGGTSPGATGTTGTSSGGSQAGAGLVYNLEEMDGKVGGTDLDKHIGHKVEVSGRLDDTKSSDQLKRSNPPAAGAPTDREIDAQDFHVSSIKMIAASCP